MKLQGLRFRMCPETHAAYEALEYEDSAHLWRCVEPLMSYVWSDEIPGDHDFAPCGHRDCKYTAVAMFAARTDLWEAGQVREELVPLWDEARDKLAGWPGFRRLTISGRLKKQLNDRLNWS